MSRTKMDDYFDQLEADLIEELDAVIGDYCDDEDLQIAHIQPPSTIVRLAAVAAAQVLMAFERGTQQLDMVQDDEVKP